MDVGGLVWILFCVCVEEEEIVKSLSEVQIAKQRLLVCICFLKMFIFIA